MKIPIFEELFFENYELDYIREKIDDSKIGKVPTYINLTNVPKDNQKDTVLKIKDLFLELNLNPRFPYPCYLILEQNDDHYFPTVSSVKELPDHFFKKVKRPNNKELQLLNKLSLKVEKIRNLDMNRIMVDLVQTNISQKKLYENTKELYFLEILNYKLIEKEKEKERDKKRK
jgi:hypothetical protein